MSQTFNAWASTLQYGNIILAIIQTLALRLLQASLTLFGVSIITWALLLLPPDDPALRLLQARGVQDPTPEQIVAVREALALDRPWFVQYFEWLQRALQGDLSLSYQSGRPVLEELGKRLPATLVLSGTGLGLAIVFTVLGGMIAAAYAERWPDRIIRNATQISAALPTFILGLLTLRFIVIELGIGRVLSGGQWEYVWLPALCLAVNRAAEWTQLLRASLIESLGSSYVFVAQARGATKFRLLWRYAFPNALLPLLTAIGVGVGGMLGGAAITEAIFTWPGIGSYVLAAINARDYPVIQGFVILMSSSYIIASFFVDSVVILLDPRLRLRRID